MKNCLLNTVLDVISSGVEPFSGIKEYIDTKNVQNHQIIFPKPIKYDTKPSRANMQVMKGDVLIAKMKNTPKVLFIDETNCDYIYSTGFAIMRSFPEKLRSRYLYHWFNFDKAQKLKDKWARGGTQKAINNTKLKTKIHIPYVELDEQDQIIKKLDEIEIFLNLLGHQIQQVNSLLYEKREEFFSTSKHLQTVETLVTSPPIRDPNFYGFKYVKTGIPVLKISNMTDNAKFNDDESSYDKITNKINQKFSKTIVKTDDLVVEVRGTYIGKTAMVPPKFSGVNINPNTVKISLDTKQIIPKYFWHFTFTTPWKNQIEKRARYWKKKFGTIVTGKLNTIEIPVPNLKKQELMVKQLDLLDEIYEKLVKNYEMCNIVYQTTMNNFFAKT